MVDLSFWTKKTVTVYKIKPSLSTTTRTNTEKSTGGEKEHQKTKNTPRVHFQTPTPVIPIPIQPQQNIQPPESTQLFTIPQNQPLEEDSSVDMGEVIEHDELISRMDNIIQKVHKEDERYLLF
jgi:hypothetical protein